MAVNLDALLILAFSIPIIGSLGMLFGWIWDMLRYLFTGKKSEDE